MKGYLFLIVFLYFFVVFQISFVPHLAIGSAIPNFTLLFIFFLSFLEAQRSRASLISALTIGTLVDIFYSPLFGPFIFIYILLAWLVKKLASQLENKGFLAFAIVLLTFLLIYYFFFDLFKLTFGSSLSFSFGSIVYNFFLGIIIYFGYVFFKKELRL